MSVIENIDIVMGARTEQMDAAIAKELKNMEQLAAAMRRDGSKVVASGYGGWVRFRFLDHAKRSQCRGTVLLHHYHGSGGGGPVTRGTIQTNRIAVNHPDANIVLTGHTHDSWTMPIPRVRITPSGTIYHDEQLHVRAPGYKDAWGDGSGGWEVERMLGPKSIGSVWLRFFYSRSRDQILYDTQKAQ